jgi:hypothetical protein
MGETERRVGDERNDDSVLVHNYAIHDHVGAGFKVMHTDGNTHFDSCPHGIFIQTAAASRHIGDTLAEPIPDWAAGFPQHDRAAWSVFGDRSIGIGRGGRRSGFGYLCPCEGRHKGQGNTPYDFFHFFPLVELRPNCLSFPLNFGIKELAAILDSDWVPASDVGAKNLVPLESGFVNRSV